MAQDAISIFFSIVLIAMFIQALNKRTSYTGPAHEAQPYDEGVEIPPEHFHPHGNASEEINHVVNEAMEQPLPDTRQLMLSALAGIGCQPNVNEDDTVSVTYQGEHFFIDFGGAYAQVWDLGWAQVAINDPELPQIREAVNHTNFSYGPTVVMTQPGDNGLIQLHSHMGMILHPALPAIDEYVRCTLDSFFHAKDKVRQNFQQIIAEQRQAREKRRPVGFSQPGESQSNS